MRDFEIVYAVDSREAASNMSSEIVALSCLGCLVCAACAICLVCVACLGCAWCVVPIAGAIAIGAAVTAALAGVAAMSTGMAATLLNVVGRGC